LILIYVIMNLPIVIWIMRDQFNSVPIELEQAALVDGATIWQAFFRIVVPIAGPGFVAAFILALVLCWNEYFFAVVISGANSPTLPLQLAGQTSSQGIRWWSIAALSTAAIAPLAIIGILLERYIVKGLTAGAVK
jgi:multiple sugar transport system permease protein